MQMLVGYQIHVNSAICINDNDAWDDEIMKADFAFRLKAFQIHLAISVAIALLVLIIVFFIWHPFPLAKAIGVTHIFLMMLTIDVILGPLLTFVVAKKEKSTLKLDLAIIGFIQFLALSYGFYNIAIARPEYIAFDLLRFETVQSNSILSEDRKNAVDAFKNINYSSPKWVGVIPPKNIQERNDRTFLEMRTGLAPSMRPNLYEPLDNQKNTIQQVAKPLSELRKYNLATDIENILLKYPQADSFLPLKANAVDMTVLIDKKSGGKVVAIVDLRPW